MKRLIYFYLILEQDFYRYALVVILEIRTFGLGSIIGDMESQCNACNTYVKQQLAEKRMISLIDKRLSI